MSSQDQEGVLCEEKALLVRKGSKRSLFTKSCGGKVYWRTPVGLELTLAYIQCGALGNIS